MVIECAFGRLKACFGILRKPIDLNMDKIPSVILICFILHNLCELHNEHIRNDKVAAVHNYNKEFGQIQYLHALEFNNNGSGGKKAPKYL